MYQTYIPNTNFACNTRIHCYLGYNCNIECEFCTNRLYENIPTKQVVQKTIDTIKSLSFDHNDSVIHLSGGELYQDCFDISIYQPLFELYNDVPKSTITNLLYNNLDRCIEMWQRYNVEVWTSYDSKGRFKNEYMLKQWFENFDYIRSKHIDPIVNIITTPFIENDINVDRLCDSARVFFSPFENKAGKTTMANLYYETINKRHCLNVNCSGYKCTVITINDTYVDQFCNQTIVTSI